MPPSLSEITSEYVNSLYDSLRTQNSMRNGEYDLSRQRYDGVLWDQTTNPAEQGRYSLSPNYLKIIIDKSVQQLIGRMPGLQVMPRGVDEDARRMAEGMEGALYGAYDLNGADEVFFAAAWDSFVLRRGVVYYWWDPVLQAPRFKHCTPDFYYPEYDGTETYHAIYVSRRLTSALRDEYPADAESIEPEGGQLMSQVFREDPGRSRAEAYTTVIDYYDRDGNWARSAGRYFKAQNLNYKTKEVPFVEFPCYPAHSGREPQNYIDQLVELNQYLAQLLSQKADIIARYANPTILNIATGQTAEQVQRAVQAKGSVIPIKADGDVRLLNWSGTPPAIDEQLVFIQDLIFDLSGKPRSAYGQTVTNQSGVATNLTLSPTLQSNEYHETIWGRQMSLLNQRLLELYERFHAAEPIQYKGRVPTGAAGMGRRYLESEITGLEIDGWYKNRIKWPAAVRVDDPVYIQNVIGQVTSDPPLMSLYTAQEELGREDAEAEIDRIEQQLEDIRLNPAGAEVGMKAAGMMMGPDGGSADAAAIGGMEGDGGYASSLEQGASPYRTPLSSVR